MKRSFSVLMGCIFLPMLSVGYIFAQPQGKAIVDTACSECHNTKRIYGANKKAVADWEVTLDQMIKKGAKVTPENRDVVLQYLNTLNK